MALITYVEHGGTSLAVQMPNGLSLLKGTRDNNPPRMDDMEPDLLDFVWGSEPVRSRLTCRIMASDAPDGLVVHLPQQQGYPTFSAG